jgi:hypothetical protein
MSSPDQTKTTLEKAIKALAYELPLVESVLIDSPAHRDMRNHHEQVVKEFAYELLKAAGVKVK